MTIDTHKKAKEILSDIDSLRAYLHYLGRHHENSKIERYMDCHKAIVDFARYKVEAEINTLQVEFDLL